MKKYLCIPALLILSATATMAQDTPLQDGKPCFTKQWVDSVNTYNSARLSSGVPIMFEWYAYEGQSQPVPAPAQMINVIRVTLQENCPEVDKKRKE